MAPSPSSFVQSAEAEEPGKGESFPAARVLFDFSPTSEFELEVSGEWKIYNVWATYAEMEIRGGGGSYR